MQSKKKMFFQARYNFNSQELVIDLKKVKQFLLQNQFKGTGIILGVEKSEILCVFSDIVTGSETTLSYYYTHDLKKFDICIDLPSNDRSFFPNRINYDQEGSLETHRILRMKQTTPLTRNMDQAENQRLFSSGLPFDNGFASWIKQIEIESNLRDMQDSDVLESQKTSNNQSTEETELTLKDNEILLDIRDCEQLRLRLQVQVDYSFASSKSYPAFVFVDTEIKHADEIRTKYSEAFLGSSGRVFFAFPFVTVYICTI